jgi:hypothetical protein
MNIISILIMLMTSTESIESKAVLKINCFLNYDSKKNINAIKIVVTVLFLGSVNCKRMGRHRSLNLT